MSRATFLTSIGAEVEVAHAINLVPEEPTPAEPTETHVAKVPKPLPRRYQLLAKRFGDPISFGPRGGLLWNEMFFAAKFATDTKMLFSHEENRFYVYRKRSGVWEHQSEPTLRVLVYESMLAYARANSLDGDLSPTSLA